MTLQIVPLTPEHLEDAARLAAGRYRRLLEQVQVLPTCYGDAATLASMLREIVAAGSGAVALEGGRLCGFLAAWRLPAFRGRPGTIAPEWAHGVAGTDGRRVYEAMYAHLAARWVAEGYRTHVVCLLAGDHEATECWQWLGFGMMAADAVRSLQPVAGGDADVRVQRAGPQDIEAFMTLDHALYRHLASSPIFLTEVHEFAQAHYEELLRNADVAVWLARQGAKALAYLIIGPARHDACAIIRDAGTASIAGAFAEPEARGNGVATALLDRALAWAREQGYERCAVDFEPMNTLARRFWLRHFQPVCYALGRQIDAP